MKPYSINQSFLILDHWTDMGVPHPTLSKMPSLSLDHQALELLRKSFAPKQKEELEKLVLQLKSEHGFQEREIKNTN